MTTLTRRELYDLVWSKPMTKLAEEFGLSDVGLSKICNKHRVPTPPRGYWARKEAGQKVKQTIFVVASDPEVERIEIVSRGLDLPDPVKAVLEQRREERKHAEPKPRKPIQQPGLIEPVERPHPAVLATAKALRRVPQKLGMAEANGAGMCGITVAPESVERVIAILDRLARSCDDRHITFAPTGNGMSATVGRDSVAFTLIERTKKIPHVLTPKEIADDEKRRKTLERRGGRANDWDLVYAFPSYRPQHDILRTGELVFEVTSWSQGLRRQWRDAKTQTIESLMLGIVAGIEAHIVAKRIQREELERAEAARRHMERRRALAKARRQRESDRASVLSTLMRLERRSAALKDWIDRNDGWSKATDPELRSLWAWAREQLAIIEQKLDPLIVAADLKDRKLFPEVDELFDPEGEPPPERRWY